MSGIGGIYQVNAWSENRQDRERLAEARAHRGQDGVGIWHQGSVGLVHRLLWTTPESCLKEFPLVSQSGDLALTADARIDNREELIGGLGLEDRPSGEITDGQLSLSAYARWGEDCPKIGQEEVDCNLGREARKFQRSKRWCSQIC